MSKRKYIIITIGIIAFLFVSFIYSYKWAINKFNDNKKAKVSEVNNVDKPTSNLTLGDKISSNTKIILKTEYKKSGDINIKEVKVSEFLGKSKENLEEQGYIVESMSAKEVILIKRIDSYAPNKYVLGVKGRCFAIYKTDENGNMYIEDESNDVTDIQVPTEGDYNLLINGSKDFQFNSREEVEEKLGEYSS
ncbi:hypothetical protein M2651_05260 [Clostridium sp. SYSU_GA19001]|uniref:hypothetical protein n=1 Tax=Clostridium caldaquaticum TaxID=2940653 RepID=UPI0020776F1D|nr:hypothetical protein [Clostridium caldaquaticum]MCM8710432.1 hypothetical protein [Clostridium caldaquaticum]